VPGRGAPSGGPSLRNAGPWPTRGADGARRGRPVADPGPATGAWDPFTFDDDGDGDGDDQVGTATIVGRVGADARRRGPAPAPRRDPVGAAPTVRPGNGSATRADGAGRGGPGPSHDAHGPGTPAAQFGATAVRPGPGPGTRVEGDRRSDGAATQFDVTRMRRDDGPATEVGTDASGDGPATMAGGRTGAPRAAVLRGDDGPVTVAGSPGSGSAAADARDDGPATMAGSRGFSRAARRRGDDGPATVAGPRAGDGPPTDVGAAGGRSGGRRRAPGRSGFGLGLRTGRSGRTGALPAAAAPAAPPAPGPVAAPRPPAPAPPAPALPAPGRPAPAPGVPRRGAPGSTPPPAARRAVDAPTELTGRGTVDDRTDAAPARRPAPTRGVPDLFRSDGYGDDHPGGDVDLDAPAGLDERDLPGVLDDLDADHDAGVDLHDDLDLDRAGHADPDLADLDDRDLDDRDLDDLDDRDLDDGDLADGDLADGDLDDGDLDDGDLDDGDLDDGDLDDPAGRPAQAWAGVVAQWLAGAVAGAVLWVLFRYLWRGLPVVALAAALLVTAGLVLLVRQFLHDVDRRTTMFAVLVGLLLTASPAVLVLLGR
jgi:hypothetical protein